MKFPRKVGDGPTNKRLQFGGDPCCDIGKTCLEEVRTVQLYTRGTESCVCRDYCNRLLVTVRLYAATAVLLSVDCGDCRQLERSRWTVTVAWDNQ